MEHSEFLHSIKEAIQVGAGGRSEGDRGRGGVRGRGAQEEGRQEVGEQG